MSQKHPRKSRSGLSRRERRRRFGEMKYIKHFEGTATDSLDQPVIIPTPDREKMKEYRAEVRTLRKEQADEARKAHVQLNEVPVLLPELPMVEATFCQAIQYFANNIPWERDEDGRPVEHAKPEEIDFAAEVVRAFGKPANGFIEVPENALTWLVDELKENGGRAFNGTTSSELRKLLDDVSDGQAPSGESDDNREKVTSISRDN